MPRDVPHNRENKRYHVAVIGDQRTLCGMAIVGVVFDDPQYWLTQETSSTYSGQLPKCEACLASEDLPLLLLGDL